MNYNVVEIFDSIEGEGKRTGMPATFIRLAGCNLRCTYCDTTYALEAIDGEYTTMPIDELLAQLKQRLYSRVTLTGGEPLTAPNVEILVYQMLKLDKEVNIETNGSVDVSFLFDYMQTKNYSPGSKLFYTMDYKLPSSGVTDSMHMPNYTKLRPCDVLKFVVGSQQDITHMIDVVRSLTSKPQIYIGAVYGKYELKNLVQTIIDTPELKNATLQVQLHKIIWDANERGV
ncbi:MAG: radical SAM protein [Firmicutes bacterium]|nr:radical SAM protein [Bacillota bacterium]